MIPAKVESHLRAPDPAPIVMILRESFGAAPTAPVSALEFEVQPLQVAVPGEVLSTVPAHMETLAAT